MKRIYLILLTLSGFMVSSCLKNAPIISATQQTPFINAARQYFSDSILTSGGQPTEYKSKVGRTILWDQAQYLTLSKVEAILVPIQYHDPLFIKATFAGNNLFHLNDLTKLLIYKHPGESFHAEVLTAIPDSEYLRLPATTFRGYLLAEDWQGNLLNQYLYTQKDVRKYVPPTVQANYIVSYCNVIYGYNYGVNAPGDGYNWTQTSACYTMYVPERDNDVHGGLSGGVGSLLGTGGNGGLASAKNITIAPPNNRISNITDYLKCFTNVGGNDHQYTVTICVDQPKADSRTPWVFVTGGPIGSTNASNVVDVGHTFLIFSETYGGTTITRNVGFYPSGIVNPLNRTSQGALNNDEGHIYNISATFTLDNAQFFNMLNYVGRGNAPGYMYDLNKDNCTSYALHTLNQGGVNLPSTIGAWPNGMGNNPGDLGEDIRQMNNLPNMTKSTVDNYHPNVGNCN